MFYKMDLVKFSLNHALELGQIGKLILPSLVTIPVVSTRIKSAKFQIKTKNLLKSKSELIFS